MGSVELGHGGGPGRGAGQVHGVLPDHGGPRDRGGQLGGGLGWGARLLGWTETAEGGEPAQTTFDII